MYDSGFSVKSQKGAFFWGSNSKKLRFSKIIHVSMTIHIFVLSAMKMMNKDSSVDVQEKNIHGCTEVHQLLL